jgi:hypothetical protein
VLGAYGKEQRLAVERGLGDLGWSTQKVAAPPGGVGVSPETDYGLLAMPPGGDTGDDFTFDPQYGTLVWFYARKYCLPCPRRRGRSSCAAGGRMSS